MGVATLDMERMARSAAAELEEKVLECISFEGLECGWIVVRWDDGYRPGPFVYALMKAHWELNGEILIPREWHFIGLFTTKGKAEAQCLDDSYGRFPAPVDKALPRERVKIRGMRFPTRLLKGRLRREPEPQQYLVSVTEADQQELDEWRRGAQSFARLFKAVAALTNCADLETQVYRQLDCMGRRLRALERGRDGVVPQSSGTADS